MLDVVDETGGAAVVLWDRDCVQLIGKSAAEIMQHEKEGIHDLPDAIHNAIMERKFLFKIPIKARPDDDYNGSYSVMKVTSDLTYINAYNQKKSDSQVIVMFLFIFVINCIYKYLGNIINVCRKTIIC